MRPSTLEINCWKLEISNRNWKIEISKADSDKTNFQFLISIAIL